MLDEPYSVIGLTNVKIPPFENINPTVKQRLDIEYRSLGSPQVTKTSKFYV